MIDPITFAEKVVSRIKFLWQEFAVDDNVIAAWYEVLGTLDLIDLLEALSDRIHAGMDRPSAAMLYLEATKCRDRRLDEEKAKRLRLEGPQISEEERIENVRKFRQLCEGLGIRYWDDATGEPIGRADRTGSQEPAGIQPDRARDDGEGGDS
jgi:hypothetical protein